MKSHRLKLVDNRLYELPTFDPVVVSHIESDHALVGTLIDQINKEQIYRPLFEGKKDLTFLDIGANIGLVSLYASPACKRIVALEPDPKTFQVLKSMTLKFPQIECVEAALAPTDGEVQFYQNDLNSTASSTVNTYGTPTMVRGMTLSSILRIHQLEHVDICKVDTEGAEGESLTLDELRVAQSIIKSYFIETHNCPKSRWEEKLGRLVEYLSQLGYHDQKINGMALYAS
jgi:FkbM family methyltransferase